MTLVDILEDIASKIPANVDGKLHSFYYGEKGWANLVNDEAVFPIMSVDFISSMKFSIGKTLFIGETYPVMIYLGGECELEMTTVEQEVVIDKEKSAARNVISQMQNYKDSNGNKLIDKIEFSSDAIRTILKPSEDVASSGIFLPLLITPAVDLSVCT